MLKRLMGLGVGIVGIMVLGGCASKEVAISHTFSNIRSDSNITKIFLVPLKNYTDVPMAGLRATNLLEGVLRAKGIEVETAEKKLKRKKICQRSLEEGFRYAMSGGVSEWRYKTGIDGEPAISVQVTLYDCEQKKAYWSGTASSDDYWRASVGTTAQSTIENLLD